MIFRSRYSIGKVAKISKKKSVGARYQQHKKNSQKLLSILKNIFFIGSILFFTGIVIFSIIVFNISKKLPDIEEISTYIPAETTKIYSTDNVVLAELHREENRELIPIEKISDTLKKAVVTVEDSNFYKHKGIDFKGITRAMVQNVKAGKIVQGGSTLTQQLARNLFLTRKQNLNRKLAEAILAVQIERQYTKTEILQMYLNQVYWGHNSYGIESASKLYFNKSASEINLAESSLLVGLLTGPELYSPIRNINRAKERQKIVLNRLSRVGIITKEDAQIAYEEELIISKRKKLRYKAPYFTEYIIKQLISMYGEEAAYTSGMKVYTTLDYRLQEKGEEVVKKWVEYGDSPKWIRGEKVPSLNYRQAALLALDPHNGHIKTMVGGKDFLESSFNRTTQSLRQPGSSFKPFLYLAALEKGFSPGDIFDDSPITINTTEGPYSPSNYSQKYSGNISMRRALEKSINVVAIRINSLIGPEHCVKIAKKLGINSPIKAVLSTPLGSNEVTMMELTSAYGSLATMGKKINPTGIIRIIDRDGSPLYEYKAKAVQVYNSNYIATLVDMMQGIIKNGTGKAANLPRPIAGKTGTTSDYRDAWFVGFAPQLVCTTWIGNDDNTPTIKVSGGWIPARMWKEYMIEALKNYPYHYFKKPKGLTSLKVNWKTKKRATEFSPKEFVHSEKYWTGKEPKEYDSADAGFWKENTNNKIESNEDFFEIR